MTQEPPHIDGASAPLILERFELLEKLGSGAQGHTYLAHDRVSDRRIALKELRLDQAADWKAMELFEREAKALQSLRHPAIPEYIDAFHDEDGERFFLAQEFMEGQSLEQRLATGEVMNSGELADFLGQMLSILEYLHGLSPPVIHRDIKPSNILVRHDGSYALIDFGAVQLVNPTSVGGSTIVGTTGYMPPEQLMGRAAPATDLFALAATAVHLITGRAPSELPVMRLKLQFRDQVGFASPLLKVLEAMLEPDVEERPARVDEVRRLLSAGTSLQSAQATPTSLQAAATSLRTTPRKSGDALERFAIEAPIHNPFSRIYCQGDVLWVHTGTDPSNALIVSGVTAVLGALVFLGACFGSQALVTPGLILMFLGAPMLGLVYHYLVEPREELLRISPAGVEVFRGDQLLNRLPSRPVFSVPLDAFDRARPRNGRISLLFPTHSSLPTTAEEAKKRAGLVLVDQKGDEYTFGAAILARGLVIFLPRPDVTELNWIAAEVDAHLRRLREAAEIGGDEDEGSLSTERETREVAHVGD